MSEAQAASPASIQLDAECITKRLGIIRSFWSEDHEWSRCSSTILTLGKPTEASVYQRNTSVFTWLLGFEFPETILCIPKDPSMEVIVIGSPKKVSIIKTGIPNIISFPKESASFSLLLSKVKELSPETTTVAQIKKDKIESTFIGDWNSSIDVDTIDISYAILRAMSSKDEEERRNLSIASLLSRNLLEQKAIPRIKSLIEAGSNKKVTHLVLSEELEHVVSDETEEIITKDADPSIVDICYAPIIQSWSNGKKSEMPSFSLKPSAQSNQKSLCSSGPVLVSCGIRYHGYCSNISRTLLFTRPSSDGTMERNLKALYDCRKEILSCISPGKSLASPLIWFKDWISSNYPQLKNNLPLNLGFTMGLEFREGEGVLSMKNESKFFQKNQCINLVLGLQDLTNSDDQTYSLLLSDTIITASEEEIPAIVLTGDLDFPLKFYLPDIASVSTTSAPIIPGTRRSRRTGVGLGISSVHDERKLKEHQKSLGLQRTREALSRFATTFTGDVDEDEDSSPTYTFSEATDAVMESLNGKIESFRNVDLIKTNSKVRIMIDNRAESVIIPINGYAVPFHISLIKSVTKVPGDDPDDSFLKFGLVAPVPPKNNSLEELDESLRPDEVRATVKELTSALSTITLSTDPLTTIPVDPRVSWLKGFTIKVSNGNQSGRTQDIVKGITDLKKLVVEREVARRERKTLVKQGSLIEKQGASSLGDISIRPSLDGSTSGSSRNQNNHSMATLEIHQNGIRYKQPNQAVDILFSNIKYLFMQPCDHESLVILHFHLHYPILLGNSKKQHRDIQVVREAWEFGGIEETGGGGGIGRGGAGRMRTFRRAGDLDEMEAEREERKRKTMNNQEFKAFANRIIEESRGLINGLDCPFRDLGFYGVPSKQTVLLQPTSDCLVSLVDGPPFLVVPFNEVEVAFLERVIFGLKNFDLVFIMKSNIASSADSSIASSSGNALGNMISSIANIMGGGQIKQNMSSTSATSSAGSPIPQVIHISSIPMTSLNAVKELLDSCDCYFVESKVNFNWSNILKTVLADPQGFYEMGGWMYLQQDGSCRPGGSSLAAISAGVGGGCDVSFDEDEDASSSDDLEGGDEKFEFTSGSESDEDISEEEEEDEESEFEDDDDSDFDNDSDGSASESSGPDWDELEEEARREDERKADGGSRGGFKSRTGEPASKRRAR